MDPSSSPRSTTDADTPPSSAAYWLGLDHEIMDTVLFPPSADPDVVAMAATASNGGLGVALPMGPLDAMLGTPSSSALLSSASVSASASASASDSALSQTPLPAGAKPKPKRKRRYNESTRAKHREVQRRFIVRKKEKMKQDKEVAQQLEKQLELVQLMAETSSLEREHTALLQQCVARGVEMERKDMKTFLEQEMEVLPHYFTPLAPHEWQEIVQQTLRYVDGFHPDSAFLDAGTSMGGWTQQSRIEHSTISFKLSKAFDDACATDVYNRTWDTLSSADIFANFFNAGAVVRTKVLQVIDDNTFILYRCIYHPSTKEITRTVDLLCRIPRGQDHLIFLQSLEGLSIQQYVGTHDSWMRGVVWCHLSPTGVRDSPTEPGCMLRWMGCVGPCPVESLMQWCSEIVFLVLRYESEVIAPLFVPLVNQQAGTSSTATSAAVSAAASAAANMAAAASTTAGSSAGAGADMLRMLSGMGAMGGGEGQQGMDLGRMLSGMGGMEALQGMDLGRMLAGVGGMEALQGMDLGRMLAGVGGIEALQGMDLGRMLSGFGMDGMGEGGGGLKQIISMFTKDSAPAVPSTQTEAEAEGSTDKPAASSARADTDTMLSIDMNQVLAEYGKEYARTHGKPYGTPLSTDSATTSAAELDDSLSEDKDDDDDEEVEDSRANSSMLPGRLPAEQAETIDEDYGRKAKRQKIDNEERAKKDKAEAGHGNSSAAPAATMVSGLQS